MSYKQPEVVPSLSSEALRRKSLLGEKQSFVEKEDLTKTAFMLFSAAKRREIREQLGTNAPKQMMKSLPKLIAASWRNLNVDDRVAWENMAAKAKEESLENENDLQCSETNQQRPNEKDDGPKTSSPRPTRPLTAFLAFVKLKRKHVKRASPLLSPDDVTRVVSKMWQDLPSAKRNRFLRQQARAMEVYEKEMKAWEENNSSPGGPLAQEPEEEIVLLRQEDTKKSKRRRLTKPSKAVRQSNLPDVITEESDPDGTGCYVWKLPNPPKSKSRTTRASVSGEDSTSVQQSLRSCESEPRKRKATTSVTAKGLRQRNHDKRLEAAVQQPQPRPAKETMHPEPATNVKRRNRTNPRTEHSVTAHHTLAEVTNSELQALNRQVELRMRKWYKYTTRYQAQVRRLHSVEERRGSPPGGAGEQGSTEDLPAMGGLDVFLFQEKDALATLGMRLLIEKRQVARTETIYGKFVNGKRKQTAC
eukprot:CAMPEP_0194046990 /NCGR_PEP_ID=MMETSP0009_2-20130614/23303_1 /TAXON_ID=210454 /ORGANISM="Grammatophora oceanica, Strain CCMP 410" /LENGTH=473 /DNA_ID=CAMNT_0038692485 /DNA_START=170 /DNA_END=1594 /DNA_ORIENTATION=+